MPRNLSNAGLISVTAQETDEIWLACVTLTHPQWAGPVRLVKNTENIVSGGDVYNAYPFDVTLPDEEPEEVPVVRFVASNVSLELMSNIRSIVGPISGEIFWVLASDPNTVELGPLSLEIRSIQYDALNFSGQMVIEPVISARFGDKLMDPTNAPGLF